MGLLSKCFMPAVDSPAHSTLGGVSTIARAALLAVAYYLTAWLSRLFSLSPDDISPLWLPSAVGLCGILLWGARMAPAICVAATLASWHIGLPFAIAFAIGIGNSLQSVVAAMLIQRVASLQPDIADTTGAFKFAAIAAFAGALAALIGTGALYLGGRLPDDRVAITSLTWWLGDTTGMLIAIPLILAWSLRCNAGWKTHRLIEIAAFALLLPGISHIAFSGIFGPLPLAFLPVPLIIWAAFRFNLATISWTAAVICIVASWNTARGRGPFALDNPDTSLLLLVLYTNIVAVLGLTLAGLVQHQRTSRNKLRHEQEQLEQRIAERTRELTRDIEHRKKIERALAGRERQLAEAQQLTRMGSWNWDLGTDRITWSDELYRIFGVDRHAFTLTPDNCRARIHQDDVPLLREVTKSSRDTGAPFHAEHRIVLPSGDIKFVSAHGYVQKDQSGKAIRIFGTTQDITEATQAQTALREAEERYRLVVELCPDAIMVVQHGIISFANPAAAALLQADGIGQVIGKPVMDLIPESHHAIVGERIDSLARGEPIAPMEQPFIRIDGSLVETDIHVSSFMHKGSFAVLLILRDITERKKTAERMAYLAHFDSLTGLPNRALFHQRLDHALSLAERPGNSLEILFLDLDRFKNINDTLGHAVGDIVLKETAQRLQSILRESDTVARLGGDEFVVLVENADEWHSGGTIAQKIMAAMEPPFLSDRTPLHISTSIGISRFPTDGTDAETLLKKADIAMYRAKEIGRSAYRYFSTEMNEHMAERLMMEYALSHAIRDNQLALQYQPKIDVLSGRVTGMEALLRWQHPTIGWVSPAIFIPLAEETGLINLIGNWAIRHACMQNKKWQEATGHRLRVAVNLSPRQLSDEHLIANIKTILEETGLDAGCLELEITENAVMVNPEKAVTLLQTLRGMGVSVVIDDFGVGYSSLAYLKRFPIHAVKIDRSFVQGVTSNAGDAAITKAIISLAHSLECSVTAEGAETSQQVDFLREHACDAIQGYYYSEPLSVDMFGDLLHAQYRTRADVRLH
jgi:diguanylate cyclase (GGDEF)-like protein/PAS domain S-box-containing protein